MNRAAPASHPNVTLTLAAAALAACVSLHAQTAHAQPAAMRAVQLAAGESVPMDTNFSTPQWQRAPAFDQFVENEPVRGQAARYRTEVRVLFDAQAIYVGIVAHDPRPAEVRAQLARHDKVFRTQDFLVVYLDAMGRKKSAQFYRVNALGLTGDGLHTDDNDNEDFSPDHDYQAVGNLSAEGYRAMLRIPFASLRFAKDATLPWRIMVGRRIPREQVRLDLSVPLPRDASSFIANLQVLEGLKPPEAQGFLQLRPTLTARSTSQEDASGRTSASKFSAGLDVKYRPNAQWVLDATLNPDFSQVELDVPQLSSNNRFALFLSEKRPVFLESRDLISAPNDAIYTRAIHDPRWVTRASLRGESISGTALLSHDRGGGLVLLPGTYGSGSAVSGANRSALARFRLDTGAGSQAATYGLVASTRQYDGAGSNQVAAADWAVPLGASGWRTTGQLAGSGTNAQDNGSGALARSVISTSGHQLRLGASLRGEVHDASIQFGDTSDGFRNDLGFASQSGVRSIGADYTYKQHGIKLGAGDNPLTFNELNLYARANAKRDTAIIKGQSVYSGYTLGAYAQTNRRIEGNLEFSPNDLVRADANSPLIRERYAHWYANGSTSSPWLTRWETYGDVGKLADYGLNQSRRALRWGSNFASRPHIRLELEPQIDQLRLGAGEAAALEETALRLLGIVHLKPRHSLRVIAQRSRYSRDASASAAASNGKNAANSLTYIWRESNAQSLYAGWSNGQSHNQGLRTSRGAEVFVKAQFEI